MQTDQPRFYNSAGGYRLQVLEWIALCCIGVICGLVLRQTDIRTHEYLSDYSGDVVLLFYGGRLGNDTGGNTVQY